MMGAPRGRGLRGGGLKREFREEGFGVDGWDPAHQKEREKLYL